MTHAYAMSHAAADGDRGKRRAPRAWLSARLGQRQQQTLGILGLQHVSDDQSSQRDKRRWV